MLVLDLNLVSSEIKVVNEDFKKVDKDGVLVDLLIKILKLEIIFLKVVKISFIFFVILLEEKFLLNFNSGECLYMFFFLFFIFSYIIFYIFVLEKFKLL